MDPRVKPEGDRKESVPEGDERRKNVPEGDRKESVPVGDERRKSVPEGDNLYKVLPRFGTNRQTIFELDEKLNNRKIPEIFCDAKNRDDFNLGMIILKIGSFLDVFWRKRGMTINVVVFSLFLLFPISTTARICFLPDCHLNDEPSSVSMDSDKCEDGGYVYYSSGVCPANYKQETCIFNPNYLKCDGTGWCKDNGYTLTSCASPKTLNTPCPSNGLFYKSCVCPSTYKYACTGMGYSSGNGTVCDSKYTKCNCATNYTWSGSACTCGSNFKYSCSGTGYSSGSGTACGGKYLSCNCSTYYSWNGNACTHTHSYVCPSGYKESNSGMISPTSKAKVCALSGCSSTSGTCYKEGHTHSYSCTNGYSTSCSNGYSSSASKVCSCGASSGTCYKCCASTYKYTCSGTGYSGGSGTACNSKYTSCTCATNYTWNGSACVCDSSFKYACSGTGEAGSGTSCGGKYKLCVCTTNYVSFCNVTFCS